MHWSISEFDYLILQVSNTKNIISKIENINNFFSNISEDSSYPVIASVNDYDFEKIFEENIYNDIMEIIAHNNASIEQNFISLCLTNNTDQNDQHRFKLSNIAEILEIIGSNGEFSFSDKLNMFELSQLKFYEYNGVICLVANFSDN